MMQDHNTFAAKCGKTWNSPKSPHNGIPAQ
jgi:hypothetical protein